MNEQECMDKALACLAIREHNRSELRRKLVEKGAAPEVADGVLDTLAKNGSLSETRYASSFIRSSNRRHPEGKSMVLMRLAAKGCEKGAAREAADELYTPEYTSLLVEKATEAIRKKGKAKNAEEIRFSLMKLGFTSSDIRNCNDN